MVDKGRDASPQYIALDSRSHWGYANRENGALKSRYAKHRNTNITLPRLNILEVDMESHDIVVRLRENPSNQNCYAAAYEIERLRAILHEVEQKQEEYRARAQEFYEQHNKMMEAHQAVSDRLVEYTSGKIKT